MPEDILTDRETLIIQLHYADGWSLSRIARGIGVSRQAVQQNHAQALTRLASYCAAKDGPFDLSALSASGVLVEGE